MIEDRLREVRLDEPALLLDLDALVARAACRRRALRLAATLAVLVALATLSALWP